MACRSEAAEGGGQENPVGRGSQAGQPNRRQRRGDSEGETEAQAWEVVWSPGQMH